MRFSMDGKGRLLPSYRIASQYDWRATDNIFIERLWRTLKYEYVNLHAAEIGSERKAAIQRWMTFSNHKHPHSTLGGKPPALVYWQRKDINQPDQQVRRVA
ncbi:transposase [Maritimibacter sp. DP07]|uniref:Transposase n=1 Tax=Maritimibacter harenae TaxID=2606218 RepID=A0A845M3Y2_9RHOB|nr:integrase core domain-containing protein [Maritimibacter harenae]MZR12193.1 transposase [Maritimibacter harenae]